jgi:hypothetical protein
MHSAEEIINDMLTSMPFKLVTEKKIVANVRTGGDIL